MALRFDDLFPVYDASMHPRGWTERFVQQESADVLRANGALLIRNTPVCEPNDLERLSRLLIKSPAEAYIGGVVPRTSHSRYVFSSTELTAAFKLKLHNEMAYQDNFPRYIAFFCANPPLLFGETPLAHNNDIQAALPEALKTRIMNDDIVYTRRYLSREYDGRRVSRFKSMFVPWQDAFDTGNKAEVESRCEELNAAFDWGPRDILTVRSVLPASRKHPDTGNQVFFNQLLTQNFSVAGLGPVAYMSYRLMGIGKEDAPRDSLLANHGPLSRRESASLNLAYSKAARSFPWKKGDWLIIDNLQVLHARNRFLGKRAIWVVMGN